MSSARQHAAAVFNEIASAAKIAIENSFTAIEIALRLSEPAERAASTPEDGDAF